MNKFKNKSVLGINHIQFRSKVESEHALWLESERRAGRVLEWIYERGYELKSEGKLIGRHKPDFTVMLPDGRVEVHEVKGGRATQTEAWRLRKKLFEANYPHIKYRVFAFGIERKPRVIQWG